MTNRPLSPAAALLLGLVAADAGAGSGVALEAGAGVGAEVGVETGADWLTRADTGMLKIGWLKVTNSAETQPKPSPRPGVTSSIHVAAASRPLTSKTSPVSALPSTVKSVPGPLRILSRAFVTVTLAVIALGSVAGAGLSAGPSAVGTGAAAVAGSPLVSVPGAAGSPVVASSTGSSSALNTTTFAVCTQPEAPDEAATTNHCPSAVRPHAVSAVPVDN